MPILLGIFIDFNILTSNNCRFSTISSLFQLAHIDCIHIIFAVCNIMNLLSANTDSVFAEFQSSCTVSYRKAIGIDSGISKSCTS